MNKTLYLHLGFHKTGTTSFQHYCASNRKLLLEYGITYPTFSAQQYRNDLPSDFENHSIPLFSLFNSNTSRHPFNIANKIIESKNINGLYYHQLLRQLQEAQNILVSGEDLATLQPNDINSLCTLAKKEGYTIVPFALIRAPYSLLNSAIQEQIKNGIYWKLVGLGDMVPPFFDKEAPLRNDLARIKNLKTIFGNEIRFIPYLSACEHPNGLIDYLFSEIIGIKNLIGIDNCSIEYKNSAKSNLWVRLQNQVNKKHPLILNDSPNCFHFKIKHIDNAASQKFLLTESEFGLIRNKFEKICSDLNSILPSKFLEETFQFSKQINSESFIEEISKQLALR